MMLEYEWGNPSAMNMILSAEEDNSHSHDTDPTRAGTLFDPMQQSMVLAPPPPLLTTFSSQQFMYPTTHQSLYGGGIGGLLQMEHHQAGPYMVVPKREEVGSSRIGLNLGGRTYFSAADDDFVSRLYRRDHGCLTNAPRCQAEGCNADLSQAKHYHRRHKVCDFHSKASSVLTSGLSQRFCQQCSRFHLLSEFDNGKRSCRKRLADHNRRRRKSHQSHGGSKPPEIATPRSSNESGTQSSSSLSVPLSPPTISLDCFRRRQFQPTASSSSSSNSMFFSSG